MTEFGAQRECDRGNERLIVFLTNCGKQARDRPQPVWKEVRIRQALRPLADGSPARSQASEIRHGLCVYCFYPKVSATTYTGPIWIREESEFRGRCMRKVVWLEAGRRRMSFVRPVVVILVLAAGWLTAGGAASADKERRDAR